MTTPVRFASLSLLAAALLSSCMTADDRTQSASAALTTCDSDADCDSTEECELEHGERFCKPHGGDDNATTQASATGDSADGPGDAGLPTIECSVDADCGVGDECEHEHGRSFCQRYGGDDADDRSGHGSGRAADDDRSGRRAGDDDEVGAAQAESTVCMSDSDCPAGQECEREHGDAFCKPHG